jgi:hypothetical protein
MRTLTKIGETRIVQFTEQVHERGRALEDRVEKYLTSMGIVYKRFSSGIDFIINGTFHMDCIAQGISGSIGDKLPHKCWKYIRKYGLTNIYILHPYSPIHMSVGEHLEDLEKQFDCQIHILDWNDFTYLMGGGKFENRRPYTYSRDSARVSNHAPTNAKLNQFFKFEKI